MDKNERTIRLIGTEAFEKLQKSKVAVVGLGGVGGHCAEALARAGVGSLHLVDNDTINETNLNRQIVATKRTLGLKKTEAMKARVADVSDCIVTTSETFVLPDTVEQAIPSDADFIVDAIDTLSGKLALVRFALEHEIPIVCAMGAGNRLDPSRFSVKDVYETSGDALARKMRQELRKMGVSKLPVVVSDEPPHVEKGQTLIGSLAPVTASAGLCLAGYVLKQLMES